MFSKTPPDLATNSSAKQPSAERLFSNDKPREACGVIGIYSPSEPAARLAYFGLQALQHRGQEAAGIAVLCHDRIQVHKGLGLVNQVFTDTILTDMPSHFSIGHTRYSTSGQASLENAQPVLVETGKGPLALAHNGNLTNLQYLQHTVLNASIEKDQTILNTLETVSDSRLMGTMLARYIEQHAEQTHLSWEEALRAMVPDWKGAYALTFLTNNLLMALRDPWGFRPLHVGTLPNSGYAIGSETGALEGLGCHSVREVNPGELLMINETGIRSIQMIPPKNPLAHCTFEHIYFSRPDHQWNKLNSHQVRQELGALLATEMQPKADIVIPVPDSSMPAAIGFAKAAQLPFNEGFIKNRYVGRTFIQPTDSLRKQGVALKFNVLTSIVKDKRVVMIDDSIVRGNTVGPLVKLLRKAGAQEVHIGVACPPIQHPCHMGINMGTYSELIAHKKDRDAMCKYFGCDSLHFLSLTSLMQALENQTGYCNACFTGVYPRECSPIKDTEK